MKSILYHLYGWSDKALVHSCDRAREINPNIRNSTFEGAIRDHFNVGIEAQKKWALPQRYCWDDTLWNKQGLGPIFILLSGEGKMDGEKMGEKYFIRQLAAEHGALLVNLEHRFYGESMPTESMSVESLGLLSVDQALEDAAYFLKHYQVEMDAVGRPVIAFGGSYSGCLAAWLRLRYPHIVAGSVTSSAPLKSQRVFPEFMYIVASSINHFGGSKCHEHLKDAVETIADMMNRTKYAELDRDFSNCKPLSTADDLFIFTMSLMDGVADAVQYNDELNFHADRMNVADMCKIFQDAENPYEGVATYMKKQNQLKGQNCTESSYKDYKAKISIENYTGTDFNNSSSTSRQWWYQTCTSFGFWQVATGPFIALQDRANGTAFEKLCRDVFGEDVTPENPESADHLAEIINMRFGGLDIGTTNVVFPQGGMDPWSMLGVQHETPLSTNKVLAWVDYGSHCSDMYSTKANESLAVTQAHEIIRGQVFNFLSGSTNSTEALSSSSLSHLFRSHFITLIIILAAMLLMLVGAIAQCVLRQRNRHNHKGYKIPVVDTRQLLI
eukprot:325856_1